ncbi:MAG: sensor histidine kinase [Lachnospiraceae bacterium]|nr:sensor histidine kinase [Lachnospiraceae bacterium]
MILFPVIQGQVNDLWDSSFLRQIYPLMAHLPLMLLLSYLTGKWLWSLISILCAYLCCQVRRWLALLVTAVLSGGCLMQDTVELLVTLPLLLLLLRFMSPVLLRLSAYPAKEQCRFGVIPAVYYVFDYLTCVYTDHLFRGTPVVVEFMPFVCCLAYLIFLIYNAAWEHKSRQLQQIQKNLDIQLAQAVQEIKALRESQLQTARYRHDLRHHMQYLSSCIKNNQNELAQTYISNICQEIDAEALKCYCENEAANLILSSFAGRMKKEGICMKVQGAFSASVNISDNDLCVLLSNALENALHACQFLAEEQIECTIDVQFYESEGRLYLQIINPCKNEIHFENGVPVSEQKGHGVGVQSICAIVERYGGIYSFSVQDEQFVLRIFL